MKYSWIKIEDMDFSAVRAIRIDTRDFHCCDLGYLMPFSYDEVKKMDEDVFLSDDQVKALMIEVKRFSGGDGEWRFLSFNMKSDDCWHLKYISLFKTRRGWIVCDRYRKPIDHKLMKEENLYDLHHY